MSVMSSCLCERAQCEQLLWQLRCSDPCWLLRCASYTSIPPRIGSCQTVQLKNCVKNKDVVEIINYESSAFWGNGPSIRSQATLQIFPDRSLGCDLFVADS